ncbi:MAG: hypothetical protein NWE89_11225 [Candidatus Bathyarchaeota archaeon]|nr:hypothetical protein [Candidatus Bathyarchaeota archaeon]
MNETIEGPRIVAGPPGSKVTKILEAAGIDPCSYSSPIVDESTSAVEAQAL